MMTPVIIDGFFLTKPVSGVERFALEIIRELDKIAARGELEMVVPLYAIDIPRYENITVIKYGSAKGILWEQVSFPRYLRKCSGNGIFLTNVIPLTYAKGIVIIHDIACRTCCRYFTDLRGHLSCLWHCLIYKRAFDSKMFIVTDSLFSRSEIIRYYHIDPERISVIHGAWQHMERIESDDSILRKLNVQEDSYCFSMFRLDGHKNISYIIERAKNDPGSVYVIAGKGKVRGPVPVNVLLPGYVSDSQAKSLMANCREFIFSSFYEGFGLPPLEALACGCRNITLSDIPVFREIYGPDIEKMNADDVLSRYSWTGSAEKLMKIIKEQDKHGSVY